MWVSRLALCCSIEMVFKGKVQVLSTWALFTHLLLQRSKIRGVFSRKTRDHFRWQIEDPQRLQVPPPLTLRHLRQWIQLCICEHRQLLPVVLPTYDINTKSQFECSIISKRFHVYLNRHLLELLLLRVRSHPNWVGFFPHKSWFNVFQWPCHTKIIHLAKP